jgi:hypothetical protein
MAIRRTIKIPTIMYNVLHKKLKIEQHNPTKNNPRELAMLK